MTAPPGSARSAEPRVEQISAEKDTDFSTRTGQMRYLVRELGISRPQAHALIRAYILDQRDADARSAAREEFSAWFRRRGDLIQVRGKTHRRWRVAS